MHEEKNIVFKSKKKVVPVEVLDCEISFGVFDLFLFLFLDSALDRIFLIANIGSLQAVGMLQRNVSHLSNCIPDHDYWPSG